MKSIGIRVFAILANVSLAGCGVYTAEQVEERLKNERLVLDTRYQAELRQKDLEISSLKENMAALAGVMDCIELRQGNGEYFLEPIC